MTNLVYPKEDEDYVCKMTLHEDYVIMMATAFEYMYITRLKKYTHQEKNTVISS